jgi:CRP/FNR family transcriptional regulator
MTHRGVCHFKPRRFDAGAQLWNQGEDQASLVFVKDGLLGVNSTDAEGRELCAGVRGPRSMLGLEALRGESAKATAIALTDATVCSAWAAGLQEQLNHDETKTLLNFVLDELVQMTRDSDLRTGPALSRVARFLVRHGRLMAPGKRAPFSKHHAAQLLAVRPETFSRCLRVLEDAGVIDARDLSVRDLSRLEGFATGQAMASES